MDGCRSPAPHADPGPRDLLVAIAPGVLAQGRHLGPHPARARREPRLRRRHDPRRGRAGRRRLPHRHPHVLRRPGPGGRSRTGAARVMRRARLLSVVVIVLCGAIGVISSTQTWLTVELADGAHHTLEVPGASAVPVLAPLSLAVLALGAALSIVGLVLRYLFGGLTVAIAAVLAWLTVTVAFTHPSS